MSDAQCPPVNHLQFTAVDESTVDSKEIPIRGSRPYVQEVKNITMLQELLVVLQGRNYHRASANRFEASKATVHRDW